MITWKVKREGSVSTVEIYGLLCPETNRVRYVGKSRNAKRRFHEHMYSARNDKRFDNTHLHRWMKKLLVQGKQPLLQILEVTDVASWIEREQYWIAFFGLDNLCNMNSGGFEPPDSTGRIWSAEARQNLSRSRKGVPIWHGKNVHPMKGKRHPWKGRKRDSSFCEKQRQRALTNNPMKGKSLSPTQLAALEQSRPRRAVIQIDSDGAIIKTWHSMLQAEKALGLPRGSVSRVCKGEYAQFKGYRFALTL